MKIKAPLTSIGVCILITVFAYLINFLPNLFYNLFSKLKILLDSNYNLRPLLYTIWQVQALISTLTVIILSIMTSLFNKRILGKRFFSALNIRSNYISLIFSSIILTLFMYFFVAQDMLSSTVFLFFSSIVIIVILLYKTISLIMNPEKLEKDISLWYQRQIILAVQDENRGINESNIDHK